MRGMFRAFAVGSLMLLLAACGDLAAVKEFSQISADGAAYSKLTKDYIAAPERERRYFFGRHDAAGLARVEKDAKERPAQAAELAAYHATIEQYMKALGALAAGAQPTFDKEVDSMVKKSATAGLLPSNYAGPVSAILALVTRAATEAYERHKIKEVILQADPPLQATIGRMKQIVGQGMLIDVDIEEQEFLIYHRTLQAMAQRGEPVAGQLVREAFDDRKEQFEPRRKAIANYVKVLEAIAAGHAHLAANADRLSADEVVATTKSYGEQIYSALKQILALRG